MIMRKKNWANLVVFLLIGCLCKAQKQNLVYVDKQGIMRYTKGNKEAAFFGVNYTVPFAYGYRSVKALGLQLKAAIDQDVYHFSRLGLDAFRVHVWDTEISDSLGNLKENEHLRLFDYLVARLKEKNIKIFLTPLAFWGNGYPERDEKTGSFSSKWNKQQVLVTEEAIKAQENYLQQILKHVNPFTKQTYEQDPDIIALEINNEPQHSGTKQQAADYVRRMVSAVKGAGWTKPVFYNISESPRYADAIANAPIDGVSFQWYPTGLVANRSLKGNLLPNVDHYKIPFGDTIPAYQNKARMVYEFDAGDVLESYMYPAMARSFRTAGFQWATQFAYDPLATAYGNTEYQTHYLNLAYTPSKAISLLIASKAFHRLPLNKSYGVYPQDTTFDVFRVSYHNQLSEMNTDQEFYYSNSTATLPKSNASLQHIAGVGSSEVVSYDGSGAYFLDKLANGEWRLEIMPDAIHIQDPFERVSPRKEVTRIQWTNQRMMIGLTDLGMNFTIRAINEGNTYTTTANERTFVIKPGVYLLSKKGNKGFMTTISAQHKAFVAPQPRNNETFITHVPYREIAVGSKFRLAFQLVGVDSIGQISVELRNSSNKWKTVVPEKQSTNTYVIQLPEEMLTPGLLNYRMIIRKKDGTIVTFPGMYTGDPYAWDAFENESWQSFVVPATSPLCLFDPLADRQQINLYNSDWRNNSLSYITADDNGKLVLKATMLKPEVNQLMAWHSFTGDQIKARSANLEALDQLVIKARTTNNKPTQLRIALINEHAQAYVAYATLDTIMREIVIPIQRLKPDSMLLLPRPYPGFLPLWFSQPATDKLQLTTIERVEFSFGHDIQITDKDKPYSIEVGSLELRQKK
jgi:hypothetical protein